MDELKQTSLRKTVQPKNVMRPFVLHAICIYISEHKENFSIRNDPLVNFQQRVGTKVSCMEAGSWQDNNK